MEASNHTRKLVEGTTSTYVTEFIEEDNENIKPLSGLFDAPIKPFIPKPSELEE